MICFRIVKIENGLRELERTWTAEDICGNSASRVQLISIQPIVSDLTNDFTKHLLIAFNESVVDEAIVMGQMCSRDRIVLTNSEVGNEDADDVN